LDLYYIPMAPLQARPKVAAQQAQTT